MKKFRIILIFSVFAILGTIFFIYKNINLEPTIVTEKNNPDQGDATPQISYFQASEPFYVQTWSDKPDEYPNLEVYEIKNDQPRQIFSGSSKTEYGVVGAIPQGIVLVESPAGIANTLVLYHPDNRKKETLVALGPNHWLSGIPSPDGRQLVFSDYCGITCEMKPGETRNTIKSINLSTRRAETLYALPDKDSPLYFIPSGWTGDGSVILTPTIEVGEGPMKYPRIYLLDVASKKAHEVSLDPQARSFAVSPNGAIVAFSTFMYDYEKNASSSAVGSVSMDGTRKIVDTSSRFKYESVAWDDPNVIRVGGTQIESFDEEDCPFEACVKGEPKTWLIDAREGTMKEVASKPTTISPVENTKGWYYFSNINTPETVLKSTELLHRYHPDTKKDEVIFRSPRSIHLVPQTNNQ